MDDLFAREHDPRKACYGPRHVNEPKRQVSQFGRAIPGKLGELDTSPDKYQRHRKYAKTGHDPHRCFRTTRHIRPHVDLEMLRLPDADHRSYHDGPNEQETRHLLGPDVGRDKRGVTRDDLQRDWDN